MDSIKPKQIKMIKTSLSIRAMHALEAGGLGLGAKYYVAVCLSYRDQKPGQLKNNGCWIRTKIIV